MKLSINWTVNLTLKLNHNYPNNRMNPTAKAAIEIPIVT